MSIVIETYEEAGLNERVFKVRIGLREYMDVEFSEFDELQLKSPKSKETPLADQLLDLELIVRRMEEQRATQALSSAKASTSKGRLAATPEQLEDKR